MTFLPMDDRNVKGVDGPVYRANVTCPVPACYNAPNERHHLWRRSFLGGDYWWVMLPNGQVWANCLWLCNEHHHQLTINAAKIEINEYGKITWTDMINAERELRIRPDWYPTYESFVDWVDNRDSKIPSEKSEEISNICPTCQRPKPKPKIETPVEERRMRRTWSISVPADKLEDGAEVLDVLLEEARLDMEAKGIIYSESSKAKYHVLSTALALFVQHSEDVLGG